VSSQFLVVHLIPLSNAEAIIIDGSHDCLRVLRLWNDDDYDNDSNSLNGFSEDEEFTVRIHSYISSIGNLYGSDVVGPPAVCLTDFQVLQRHPRKNKRPGSRDDDHEHSSRLWKQAAEGRVPGSRAPEFLAKYAKSLSISELAGKQCHRWFQTKEHPEDRATDKETKLATIADFLARHHAVQTLHQCSPLPQAAQALCTSPQNDPKLQEASSDTVDVYMKTLEQFQNSQLNRQKASLTSNAGRESASVSQQIVEQHQSALQAAIEHATAPTNGGQSRHVSVLTLETLQVWHGRLTQNLQPDAGSLRTKNVKVGKTCFAKPSTVPSALRSLMDSFQELEERCLFLHPGTRPVHHQPDAKERALAAILFASVVFFGIVDVHGFSDGNGRLARIAANWALAKTGFPFCVSFHATPSQRTEYSRAIRKTRRNIDAVPVVLSSDTRAIPHTISDDQYLYVLKQFGIFAPIFDVLLDRVYKTISEFQKSLEEATAQRAEKSHELAARLFRERAAQNSCCLICLDGQPNIATLCCGKAAHLNCMAEWLASKNSCPNCRANLPSIPQRLLQNGNNRNGNNRRDNGNTDEGEEWTTNVSDEDVTNDTTSDTEGMETSQENNNNNVNTDETTTSDDGHDNDDTRSATFMNDSRNNPTEDNDTTTDDTISDDDTVTVPSAMNVGHDTTVDDDDDTTTTTSSPQTAQQHSSPPRNQAPTCRTCRNRAAVDCGNRMCGRCCVLEGRLRCFRHSSY
jgi:fido (protein-threonine AMPylation protein)